MTNKETYLSESPPLALLSTTLPISLITRIHVTIARGAPRCVHNIEFYSYLPAVATIVSMLVLSVTILLQLSPLVEQ